MASRHGDDTPISLHSNMSSALTVGRVICRAYVSMSDRKVTSICQVLIGGRVNGFGLIRIALMENPWMWNEARRRRA